MLQTKNIFKNSRIEYGYFFNTMFLFGGIVKKTNRTGVFMKNKNAIQALNKISSIAKTPKTEAVISDEINIAISSIGKTIPQKEFPLIFASAIMSVDNVYDRSCAKNIIKALHLHGLSHDDQSESFNISALAVDCIYNNVLKAAKNMIKKTNDPVILSKKIALSVFYSKNNYEQSMIIRVFENLLQQKYEQTLDFN